jgi:hypothetical protein
MLVSEVSGGFNTPLEVDMDFSPLRGKLWNDARPLKKVPL